MRIGGFQRFTLVDYPGKMAAIVFTQGCNFRCGYCHNPQLVCPEKFQKPIPEEEVLEFLRMRQGKLEGVVVTGGEPTIHRDLPQFLSKIKELRYAIKLDTNGSNPYMLLSLIQQKLVDFIAMDIKTSLDHYPKAVGIKQNSQTIKSTIEIILKSGLRHQFRTTLVKGHCNEEDLKGIQELIKPSTHYILQSFVPLNTIVDPKILDEVQYTASEVQALRLKYQKGP
jgi:pyruvate formate lyase activating enzyme